MPWPACNHFLLLWRREQLKLKLQFLRNCLWHSHRTHTNGNNKKIRVYFFNFNSIWFRNAPYYNLLFSICFSLLKVKFSTRRNLYFSHHFLKLIYKMHSTFFLLTVHSTHPGSFLLPFSIHYYRLLFRLVIALLCRDQKRCSNEEEIKARELQLNYYYTF